MIHVTTLAGDGPGSLAEAIAVAEPRVIEFAVGGIIDLGGHSLKLTQPYLTIAGETAPIPGITLTNGDLSVVTHDVIVRHLRIRAGAGTRARKSGWEVDGLTTGGGAHDVIVAHCSLSWSTDENLSASGPQFKGATPDEWRKNTSHRITFSHCIVGEGLNDPTHSKGPHSKGSLFHGPCDFYLADNLFFDAAGQARPVTPGFRDRTRFRPEFTAPLPGGSGYEYRLSAYNPPPEMRRVGTPSVWPPRLKARPASETQAWVLANAGARPWERDAVDRRLIEEARTGGGKIIDLESEVGGLPKS